VPPLTAVAVMVTECSPSKQTEVGNWLNETDGVTAGVTVTFTDPCAVQVPLVTVTPYVVLEVGVAVVVVELLLTTPLPLHAYVVPPVEFAVKVSDWFWQYVPLLLFAGVIDVTTGWVFTVALTVPITLQLPPPLIVTV
jgi:hypothetical protein